MMFPKKTKYRKKFRLDVAPMASRRTEVSFGSFGLQTQESSWITSRQIEASRRAMTRYIKRGGKIWIRIFPDQPVTLKGGEIRMGGGKGAVDHYVANVPAGTVMIEIDGVSADTAKEALRLAGHKLPVRTKVLTK